MLALATRLLQDLPEVRRDDGVCGEDQGGLVIGGVDCGGVDVLGFGGGGREDVFEGREGVGLVFGDGRGNYFKVGEADLFVWMSVSLVG